uniref:Endonuclease/exonuclease/phosphatase domain-containing protein n=1 Tax=Amphiprion percula TaxID=161767 RepID=A0A3P8TTV5_AMPPE
ALKGQYSLINIYAPNTDSPEFFVDICNIAKQIGNFYVIIGGDFNQVRDPALDKLSSTNNRPKQKSVLTVDTMRCDSFLVTCSMSHTPNN